MLQNVFSLKFSLTQIYHLQEFKLRKLPKFTTEEATFGQTFSNVQMFLLLRIIAFAMQAKLLKVTRTNKVTFIKLTALSIENSICSDIA